MPLAYDLVLAVAVEIAHAGVIRAVGVANVVGSGPTGRRLNGHRDELLYRRIGWPRERGARCGFRSVDYRAYEICVRLTQVRATVNEVCRGSYGRAIKFYGGPTVASCAQI